MVECKCAQCDTDSMEEYERAQIDTDSIWNCADRKTGAGVCFFLCSVVFGLVFFFNNDANGAKST